MRIRVLEKANGLGQDYPPNANVIVSDIRGKPVSGIKILVNGQPVLKTGFAYNRELVDKPLETRSKGQALFLLERPATVTVKPVPRDDYVAFEPAQAEVTPEPVYPTKTEVYFTMLTSAELIERLKVIEAEKFEAERKEMQAAKEGQEAERRKFETRADELEKKMHALMEQRSSSFPLIPVLAGLAGAGLIVYLVIKK